MNKKSTKKILILVILCSSLLLSQVLLVGAQKLDTPLAQATPTKEVLNIDATEIPFRIIQEEDIPLSGPFDSAYFPFAIPNAWKISPNAKLHLDMTVDFNKVSSNEFGYPLVSGGGTLIIYLNNTLLGVVNLDEVGDVQLTLPVPLAAFVSNREDGKMAFYAELDASDFCYVAENFNLFIHPTSYFSLPHEIAKPVADIINLPSLLYQDSFVQESALIVLPDQPSAPELQAALTVAGSLGNFSQNNLPIDVTTISALTLEQKTLNHLLLVGKPAAFNILDELNLPAKPTGNGFQIAAASTDAGVIQLVNSPWDISKMVAFISGSSDEGVVKASQAVSTGVLRPHRFMNLAVVDDVQSAQATQATISTAETRTLADMGYEGSIFKYRGFNSATYNFQIPLGWTATEDAYFELAYGFSSLIDYEQSGIIVTLNENPIGSVRFDAETAQNAINKVRIDIPETAVIPGVNVLAIQAYMFPNDICTPPDAQGLWINIWNESVLSAPLTQQQVDINTVVDLTDYPSPFVFDFELNNTAFVLPKGDIDALRGAVKAASYLAYQTNPSIITLSAFYGDEFPENARQNYNMILMGKPSQISLIDEIGDLLPVPFETGRDTALEGNLRVVFNIPEDAPLGYVELLASPWNPENVIVAVLGNSTQGEVWAVSAMNDATLRSQLSGNFVIVNNRQILASDTRVFPVSENPTAMEGAPEINILATPEASQQPGLLPQNQDWIPIAIMVGIGLIVLIIVIVLLRSFLQKRSRT